MAVGDFLLTVIPVKDQRKDYGAQAGNDLAHDHGQNVGAVIGHGKGQMAAENEGCRHGEG